MASLEEYVNVQFCDLASVIVVTQWFALYARVAVGFSPLAGMAEG